MAAVSSSQAVFLLSAARTPIGAYQGALARKSAPALGAAAIAGALSQSGVTAEAVPAVFMGNVLSAGLGQAPARQAALAGGLPESTHCTGVSKVCGSGLEAVILARRALLCGDYPLAMAGGMESMSQVPHYLAQARQGYRLGHGQLTDGLIHDGLWDPYNDFHMGEAAELCVDKYAYTRSQQDGFATESYRRARDAQDNGRFAEELVEVSIEQRRGEPVVIAEDEEPRRGKPEKFSELRPAFRKNGTITAANASTLNDGAAALLLASERWVEGAALRPIAKLVASGAHSQDPRWFTTAPVGAVRQVLQRAGWEAPDVDLWEINEAFSCVTLACAHELRVDLERVNVHGGAVALGHPIGASGARILTTLVHALRTHDKQRGVATLCIGGGEAVALAIERI